MPTFWFMRKLILILFLTLIPTLIPTLVPTNVHAECTTKACIDVYVQDGKVVIEGKRNGATSSPKPRVIKPSAPRPKPTSTRKYTYRPRTSMPRARTTSPSLADKVLESLPTLQVAYQPEGAALTRVPLIFFTDLPPFFNKTIRIVGVNVKVSLKPQSLWSFGDGSVLVTSKPGHPYPSTEITHSYSAPGTYAVVVATLWRGTFEVEGVKKEIPGVIRQVSGVDVKVVGAKTAFVGK